jgi:hypothetical protein
MPAVDLEQMPGAGDRARRAEKRDGGQQTQNISAVSQARTIEIS